MTRQDQHSTSNYIRASISAFNFHITLFSTKRSVQIRSFKICSECIRVYNQLYSTREREREREQEMQGRKVIEGKNEGRKKREEEGNEK